MAETGRWTLETLDTLSVLEYLKPEPVGWSKQPRRRLSLPAHIQSRRIFRSAAVTFPCTHNENIFIPELHAANVISDTYHTHHYTHTLPKAVVRSSSVLDPSPSTVWVAKRGGRLAAREENLMGKKKNSGKSFERMPTCPHV